MHTDCTKTIHILYSDKCSQRSRFIEMKGLYAKSLRKRRHGSIMGRHNTMTFAPGPVPYCDCVPILIG